MLKSILRKAAIPMAAAALLAGSLSSVQAADAVNVTIGEYIPSSTPSVVSMPLSLLGERADLQEKHGINVDLVEYSNLSALYSDLALGRVEVSLTGPATLATLSAKGAPLALAGTIGRATNAILSNGKSWDAETLKGSRLVAQTSSSSWTVVQAIIERNFGLKAGEDYEVINSDSTAAAALQVAAEKADFAIVRAEQVLLALSKFDNLQMVADPKALGREEGVADWGYILSYNHEQQDAATMEKLMAALAEVGDWMDANPAEVETRAVAAGREPGIAEAFLTTGLFQLDVRTAAEAKESLMADYDLLKSVGYLAGDLPDTVFPK
ncbi:ABC transporter substrate-binding protein [Marivita sp. S6314]|uniref:ABC transporter substrate-binding protein n=1 Tax=Marivita sp. S6314 TaxID=2926406 RepID=UPI001FF62B19|nr:PhnD/SsuA/transferrin family substrate-binding protein [Marivita sp. S6314]MCK0150860.1 ABC transporter substrate-binding protein [Marivita sp. S6314]